MTRLNNLRRRNFLKIAAVLGSASTVAALPKLAAAHDAPQQTGQGIAHFPVPGT